LIGRTAGTDPTPRRKTPFNRQDITKCFPGQSWLPVVIDLVITA